MSATKSGGYGTTLWHHDLDCGHVLSHRRRIPDGKQVFCDTCASIKAEVAALEALPPLVEWVPDPVEPVVTELDAQPSSEAEALELAARYRAALAGSFGLPLEAVEVAVAGSRILGARILLDLPALQRLGKDLT